MKVVRLYVLPPMADLGHAAFPCTEAGCVKVFQTYSGLEAHLSTGRHVLNAQRETLLDSAMRMYASKMESVRLIPHILPLQEAFDSLSNSEHIAEGRELAGWALRQTKQAVRFSDNLRDYLLQKFDEGERRHQKFDPRTIASAIR